MAKSDATQLGTYLRDRRGRLDPAACGFSTARRRTPGLRREEVAQRANVSATWYTWLEQGRGGTPSVDVLDRLARALALNAVEREHLFLLAQHRPPQVRYQPPEPVSPQLQRVLDSLEFSPAYVRTATWDIVAWNRAASLVLTNYGDKPPEERNILRFLFCEPRLRTSMVNWKDYARFAVATFRSQTVRAGAAETVAALVEDLSRSSPEFAAIWQDHDVREYGEGAKHFDHPIGGPMTLEHAAFAVDGRPDLGLIIFTPATPADAARVRAVIEDDAQRVRQPAPRVAALAH